MRPEDRQGHQCVGYVVCVVITENTTGSGRDEGPKPDQGPTRTGERAIILCLDGIYSRIC